MENEESALDESRAKNFQQFVLNLAEHIVEDETSTNLKLLDNIKRAREEIEKGKQFTKQNPKKALEHYNFVDF